jgi:MFS family permease
LVVHPTPVRTTPDDFVERNFRWNAVWFILDFVLFGVGMAFFNQTTVLPTFVGKLTDSTVLIGLIATIQSGAWLLPQLFAASYVAGRARKRPYMVIPAFIGRPIYAVLAVLTVTIGASEPAVLLITFYVAMTIFGVTDALCSVPWYDIQGKAVPADRRGRLFGVAQVINGLLGVALGGVVGYILSLPSLTFPNNYALLFGIGTVAFLLGAGALSRIREPVIATHENRQPVSVFFRAIIPTLRTNPPFVRITATRLLLGVGAMIFPFYVIYAERVLGFGDEHIGLFLSAQVFGGVIGGLLFGQIADRWGTRSGIRTALVTAALAPVLAIVARLAGPTLGGAQLYVMAATFSVVGMTFSSYLICFMNHVLEIAPKNDRSTYAGLFNTINGSLLFIPTLAGWLLEVTSFDTVFVIAIVAVGAAGVASLGLGEPRHQSSEKASA